MDERRIVTHIPLIIDAAMVLSLLSLSYWVGVEANKVDNLSVEMRNVQQQVTILSASGVYVEVAAMKERIEGEKVLTNQFRSEMVSRLDRIERKLDKK